MYVIYCHFDPVIKKPYFSFKIRHSYDGGIAFSFFNSWGYYGSLMLKLGTFAVVRWFLGERKNTKRKHWVICMAKNEQEGRMPWSFWYHLGSYDARLCIADKCDICWVFSHQWLMEMSQEVTLWSHLRVIYSCISEKFLCKPRSKFDITLYHLAVPQYIPWNMDKVLFCFLVVI